MQINLTSYLFTDCFRDMLMCDSFIQINRVFNNKTERIIILRTKVSDLNLASSVAYSLYLSIPYCEYKRITLKQGSLLFLEAVFRTFTLKSGDSILSYKRLRR